MSFRFYIIFACIIICNLGSTQNSSAYQKIDSNSDFIITKYNRESVLPSNTVTDIHISKEGLLYVASNNGLIIHDGQNWDILNMDSHEGFQSNQIQKIYESSTGNILILDHLSHLYHVSKSRLVSKIDLMYAKNEVRALASDSVNIYVVVEEAVLVYDDFSLKEHIPLSDIGRVWDLIVYDNALFIVSTDGVYTIKNKELTRFEPQNSNVKTQYFARFDIIDDDLVLIGRGGVDCISSKESISCNTLSTKLPKRIDVKNIRRIQNPLNEFIIARSDGIFKNNKAISGINSGIRFESYFEIANDSYYVGTNGVWVNENKIFTPKVEVVDAISDGYSLWLTTDQEGIIQISKTSFSHLSGIPFTNNYAILEYENGKNIAGSFEYGITVIDGNQIEEYTSENSELPNNTIRMLSTLADGSLLVSTWGARPVIFRDNQFYEIDKLNQIEWSTTNVTEGFYEYDNGDWLLGTLDGLLKVSKEGVTWIKKENGEQLKGVSKIVPFSDTNELLMCSQYDGVYRLKSDSLIPLTDNQPEYAKQVRDIYVQSSDTIWVTSYNVGLQRYIRSDVSKEEFSVSYYSENIGIKQKGLHAILKDSLDNIWIPSNDGLLNFYFDDLLDAIDNNRVIANLNVYTENNGLLNREFNGGSQNISLYDKKGNIWFSNQAGLVHFNPSNFKRDSISITNFQLRSVKGKNFEIRLPDSDTLEIEYSEKNLTIEFSHINLTNNKTDNIWIKQGSYDWVKPEETGVFITYPINNEQESIKFAMQPSAKDNFELILVKKVPFYASYWFKFVLVISVISFLYVVIDKFTLRKKKKEGDKSESKQGAQPTPVDPIKEVIYEHFRDPEFNLDILAKLLKMSRSKVYRIWSNEEKSSLNEFILEVRLSHSVDILSQKDASITEAALDSGFRSQSYYSKVFKKYYGYSPSDYSKKINN